VVVRGLHDVEEERAKLIPWPLTLDLDEAPSQRPHLEAPRTNQRFAKGSIGRVQVELRLVELDESDPAQVVVVVREGGEKRVVRVPLPAVEEAQATIGRFLRHQRFIAIGSDEAGVGHDRR
jgi:hypothetical protein